jgi:putative peptide zinc metalloprotease protein
MSAMSLILKGSGQVLGLALMSNNSISLAQRRALLVELPIFSMYSRDESHQLVKFFVELDFAAGTKIVAEDDLIDRVYIIVSGEAEVTHRVVAKKKLQKAKIVDVPLAVLNAGDTIGLANSGFYSTTGKRTATVTAVTDVKCLALDIKMLHEFLKDRPHLQSAMFFATAQMLRLRLIKQSLPFVRLSHERALWLADQVEQINVSAGEIIFSQGDPGDSCYLIRSGKIEIIATDAEGVEKRLALLTPPTLFGEATLISRDPRNATARAVENSELMLLKHKYLSELIETEHNVANMFMTLMVDRSRPARNPHVSVHHRTAPDGQPIVILKNHDNGSYFKLSQEGLFIWEQLNGSQTMQAITMGLSDKFDTFAPDMVAGLISKLARAGFVDKVETPDKTSQKNKTLWRRNVAYLSKFLDFRYAFGDADKWLTSIYNKGINKLYTRAAKFLLSFIAIAGFITFIWMTNDTIETFKIMPDVWWLFVALVPATLISVALHELGHAFAVKSFGYEVHYMGVGWMWVTPVAFTDTSDMWLSTKWPRLFVNMAGVFMDSLVAGVCALLILVIANPYIQAFLWMFALYTYINAFRNMSPLQELNGYYVLMDLVEKPHLRHAAVRWLIRDFPKALRNPSLFKQHMPEVWYWIACLLFLLGVTIITLLVQTFVFTIIGIHTNLYISLSLPFLVAIFSVLGLVAEVRHQTE